MKGKRFLARTWRGLRVGQTAVLLAVSVSTLLAAPPSMAAGPWGWRGQGDGHFDQATPPLTWGSDNGILWSTPLDSWSNASPVVAGSVVFVTSEPTSLVALDTGTGKVLWKHTHAVIDALDPAAAAPLRPRMAAAPGLEAELSAGQHELGRLRRQARRGKADAAVMARQAELEARLAAIKTELDALAAYRTPSQRDIIGYASSTPVSDGKSVWALFGNGVIASYTLDGALRWRRWLGPAPEEMQGYPRGNAASPLLLDGVLVVPYGELRGLDPATGAERWHAGPYLSFGTPLLTRAGSAGTVVVTTSGDVVRLRDGAVLVTGGDKLLYVGPVAVASGFYLVGAGSDPGTGIYLRARKFVSSPGGAVAVQPTRERHVTSGDELFAQPLVVDGLIYVVSKFGVLRVLDSADTALVYEQKLDLGENAVFPSPTLAGGRIYISGSDGRTVVIQPGRRFAQLAVNDLGEGSRASPFFTGGRVYVRTFTRLVCLSPP